MLLLLMHLKKIVLNSCTVICCENSISSHLIRIFQKSCTLESTCPEANVHGLECENVLLSKGNGSFMIYVQFRARDPSRQTTLSSIHTLNMVSETYDYH